MFGFFKKLAAPFAKMKSFLGQKIKDLFSRGADERAFDELERLFYEADLGAATAAELVDKIRQLSRKKKDLTSDEILSFVKSELLAMLGSPHVSSSSKKPHVILMVGVNGSGKTTSLAKLASHYRSEGKKVLIAAGDTFRAAAVEQLETWANRVGVDIIKAQPKSDPSAVAFDALQAAQARGVDIVLIDTAGRLQTKTDLMNELAKVRRVCQKQIPDSPHETLLALDATVGQNALDQAKTFHQFTPITGIILTKLDGSAKGGIAVAIQSQLKIPILWVGTGEGAEDLAPFDSESYVSALLK
ncbi:MAG: signal recognition particle-docking protein FtsY [Verrucomicrobia bacterium]|nr:signal recognition particle-docking protein FtsY [Verrucomicrobiota bacterium]